MNEDFQVLIDGTQFRCDCVFLHYQRDPFPGGLHFEWSISAKWIPPRLAKEAKFHSCVFPDESIARRWMYWLASILGDWNRQQSTNVSTATKHDCVFLNTIDELVLTKECLFIQGKASPYYERGSGGEKR